MSPTRQPLAYLDKDFGMLLCPKCVNAELQEASTPSRKSQFHPIYDLTSYLGDDEELPSFGKPPHCDLCGEQL